MKENNSQEFKPIKGILISSGCLGLYDNKRNDISLISLETDATVCGYFTQNIYRSATVVISEKNIIYVFKHKKTTKNISFIQIHILGICLT